MPSPPPLPLIDIFAGPGGLGEGFASLRIGQHRAFRSALSIEKDPVAHRTLKLRAFTRHFPDGQLPDRPATTVVSYIATPGKFQGNLLSCTNFIIPRSWSHGRAA